MAERGITFGDQPVRDVQSLDIGAAPGGEPRVSAPASASQATVSLNANSPNAPAQIAGLLVERAGQRVEISLRPEELGAVRMTLSLADSGAIVTISADRPETLDLMRRHADSLAEALRALGHGAVSFSFDGAADGNNRSESPDQTGHATDSDPDPATEPQTRTAASGPSDPVGTGGLDLRL